MANSEGGHEWWRNAVIYQVYVRSFADGNGDGTGDIAGLRERLPYIRDLGVDAVWLNPWFTSPLHDGGYDVADYRDIEPRFGTLDEAMAFIAEAREHGLRVLLDLVPNHSSSEHAWFREAISAEPGSPARDRYHFRPGKGVDGGEPPNDWRSVFGGPGWTQLPDGDWYLHLFDVTQPDLNWDNPEVRAEFRDIIRFWLDRGVDGFRVDVAHALIKHPDLPDLGAREPRLLENEMILDHPHWDRDEVHEIIREWRAILDEYDDRMMVAEAWVHTDRLPLYLRPDEYHQSFNFDLLEAPWDADTFKAVISGSLASADAVGAPSTWVLSNHDVVRHATRYGLPNEIRWRSWVTDGPHDALDADRGARRARAAILVLLSLPGSAYLFQGEELGLPEVYDLPDDALDDPAWERSGHQHRGRDGCRVPIPWSSDGTSFGFGSGGSWLPQPASFAGYAADLQATDPHSMLSLYRQAISLRKELFGIDDDLEMVDLGLDVLAHRRGDIVVVANMGSAPIALPDGEVLLSSADSPVRQLRADAAAWLRVSR